jgi:hypothetical protein
VERDDTGPVRLRALVVHAGAAPGIMIGEH